MSIATRLAQLCGALLTATLNFLGVPAAEHKEFMAVIEHYRPEVTGQEAVEKAGTLEPAVAQA
jgi:hemoglobin